MFEHVDAYAGDPILTLVETFHKDTREQKVNLGIGLYYDEQGRIPLLASVQQAEAQRAAAPAPRPYQPMEGAANYRTAVQHLLFGADHEAVKAGRIATIQTIGGSGALKIGADLLKRYFPTSEVWVSNPTWDNHKAMFEGAGIKVHDYPYYDAATGGVQFDAMIDCLSSLPAKSIVLLHPAATTRPEWISPCPVGPGDRAGGREEPDPLYGHRLSGLRRRAGRGCLRHSRHGGRRRQLLRQQLLLQEPLLLRRALWRPVGHLPGCRRGEPGAGPDEGHRAPQLLQPPPTAARSLRR